MIVGGWEFIWAAYGITWLGITLYVGSLITRTRQLDEALQAMQSQEALGENQR